MATGCAVSKKSSYIQAPVVFLHGTAASPRQWRELIGRLPQAIETLALDLPDYVAHDVHPAQRSLSQEAQLLIPRLSSIGQPFHLVGHSYGGALALRIAMLWPSLVRSLTIFEPVTFHLLRDGHSIEQQMHDGIDELVRHLKNAEAAGTPALGAARFVDFWNGPGAFANYAPEMQEKVTARLSLILSNFAALHSESWPLAECARITAPTLSMFGQDSPLAAQHLTRLVTGQIAQSQLIPVAAAGHMLPITHAGTVARYLSAHVLAAEAQALKPRAA
jgi:pimeloyl-ACP methyl ester carboxylesterase